MITADQLLCHAVGDYVIQSDWMALNKVKRLWIAVVHAVTYALPFLLLSPSLLALVVIVGTHAVIDHWRLARYVVWARNFMGTGNKSWEECSGNGFSPDRPIWLTTWLTIAADNIMHIVINGAALAWWS